MLARPHRRTSRTFVSDRCQREADRANGVSMQAPNATASPEQKKPIASSLSLKRILMIPAVTPSQPVVIPTRTRQGEQRRRREKPLGNEIVAPHNKGQHDPQSVPPSVAALLAITSIPGQRHTRRTQRSSPGIGSVYTRSPRAENPSRYASTDLSPGSWEILLSPPMEADSDDVCSTSDITVGLPSPAGSCSSESMPPLETDTDSWGSASSLSTRELSIVKRTGGERRLRASPSQSEECGLDHPLLPGPTAPDPPRLLGLDDLAPLPVQAKPRGATKSTFKSHLTASLRTIKSAAVSLSGWTPPMVQRDDYLARAVLSISLPFTDERRPLSSTGVPDPALRRYLNPVSVSPAELYFHRPSARNMCTASIQLRTIRKGDQKSAHATAPPVFAAHPGSTPASDPSTGVPTRQREPRENSNFLRVIVLEMNMRRAGKLSQAAPGRARLWLPARPGASAPEGEDGAIPRRWVDRVP